MKHLLPFCSLLVLLLPSAGQASPPPKREINVYVDLTDEGRKVDPATPAKPVYYYPIVGGFREEGAVTAGDKPPPPRAVLHELAEALAKQGYLVMGKHTPPPTIVLVFFWGSMNAEVDDGGDPDEPSTSFFNQRQMLALVGGQTLDKLYLGLDRDPIMQAAEEDRYFAIVTAYDINAAQKNKKVRLWRARMSTSSNGVSLGEVIGALAASGGPHFGRETTKPAWIEVPLDNRGKVKLGPTIFKDYPEPATPTASPAAAAPAATPPQQP